MKFNSSSLKERKAKKKWYGNILRNHSFGVPLQTPLSLPLQNMVQPEHYFHLSIYHTPPLLPYVLITNSIYIPETQSRDLPENAIH